MIVVVDGQAGAHLALAIARYVPWARANGLQPPPELLTLGEYLANDGRNGQAAAAFRDLAAEIDTPPMAEQSLLMGYGEAAAVLGLSERGVRRLVVAGELPSIQIERRVLIARADLEAFVERRRPGSFREHIETKGSADAENHDPTRRRHVTVHRRAG